MANELIFWRSRLEESAEISVLKTVTSQKITISWRKLALSLVLTFWVIKYFSFLNNQCGYDLLPFISIEIYKTYISSYTHTQPFGKKLYISILPGNILVLDKTVFILFTFPYILQFKGEIFCNGEFKIYQKDLWSSGKSKGMLSTEVINI